MNRNVDATTTTTTTNSTWCHAWRTSDDCCNCRAVVTNHSNQCSNSSISCATSVTPRQDASIFVPDCATKHYYLFHGGSCNAANPSRDFSIYQQSSGGESILDAARDKEADNIVRGGTEGQTGKDMEFHTFDDVMNNISADWSDTVADMDDLCQYICSSNEDSFDILATQDTQNDENNVAMPMSNIVSSSSPPPPLLLCNDTTAAVENDCGVDATIVHEMDIPMTILHVCKTLRSIQYIGNRVQRAIMLLDCAQRIVGQLLSPSSVSRDDAERIDKVLECFALSVVLYVETELRSLRVASQMSFSTEGIVFADTTFDTLLQNSHVRQVFANLKIGFILHCWIPCVFTNILSTLPICSCSARSSSERRKLYDIERIVYDTMDALHLQVDFSATESIIAANILMSMQSSGGGGSGAGGPIMPVAGAKADLCTTTTRASRLSQTLRVVRNIERSLATLLACALVDRTNGNWQQVTLQQMQRLFDTAIADGYCTFACIFSSFVRCDHVQRAIVRVLRRSFRCDNYMCTMAETTCSKLIANQRMDAIYAELLRANETSSSMTPPPTSPPPPSSSSLSSPSSAMRFTTVEDSLPSSSPPISLIHFNGMSQPDFVCGFLHLHMLEMLRTLACLHNVQHSLLRDTLLVVYQMVKYRHAWLTNVRKSIDGGSNVTDEELLRIGMNCLMAMKRERINDASSRSAAVETKTFVDAFKEARENAAAAAAAATTSSTDDQSDVDFHDRLTNVWVVANASTEDRVDEMFRQLFVINKQVICEKNQNDTLLRASCAVRNDRCATANVILNIPRVKRRANKNAINDRRTHVRSLRRRLRGDEDKLMLRDTLINNVPIREFTRWKRQRVFRAIFRSNDPSSSSSSFDLLPLSSYDHQMDIDFVPNDDGLWPIVYRESNSSTRDTELRNYLTLRILSVLCASTKISHCIQNIDFHNL